MKTDKEIFLIFLKVVSQVLDAEIKDEEKRSKIFNKILDDFIFEMKLKVQSLKKNEKKS